MKHPAVLLLSSMLIVSACGGGGSSAQTNSPSGNSNNTGNTGNTGTGNNTVQKKASQLVSNLGKTPRLLIGLGSANVTDIQSQNIRIDIYDQYLNGVGAGSWPSWNSPSGAYVQVVAQNAGALGAVPMFTLYQMAANGDGNLSGLTNQTFMSGYWNNVRLLFQQLKTYGKPALVNFEPDFWGYTERAATGNDPTTVPALVSSDQDCSSLPNNVYGVAQCLLQIARKYAPNAYVGFPPSLFADLTSTELSYMQKLGAGQADFIVMQTLDRDAGCFEVSPQPSYCQRSGSGWYWDETNISTPNFTQHFTRAKSYSDGLVLPLIWWQTPLGVPSAQAGGNSGGYRDNRAHYFLTHASELVAAGGIGAVFSTGETHQTSILTDGGQFKTLSGAYLANPAPLN